MVCDAQLDTGFVTGAFGFIDCQAKTLGALGFQALAAPGSIVSLALTGLLTLFVAGFGFRMLMGETPAVRDGVTGIAKIAFVLALATAWVPYRTLVYDVVLRGPAELTGAIGAPAGLPGAAGDLAERLDLVDQALIQLNDLGSGRPRAGQQDMRNRQVNGSDQVIVEPAQGNPNPFEPYAFALGRIAFLVGAVGAFGATRIVAGLLLALGPVFVAFALFDATRGLFEGWVRALVGTMIAGIGVAVVLASELAMTETWIAGLLAERLSNASIGGAAIELVVVTIVFDLMLVAMLVGASRVATGFRLPGPWRDRRAARSDPRALAAPPAPPATPSATTAPRTRALAIADGVTALQRREAAQAAASATTRGDAMARGPRRASAVAASAGLHGGSAGGTAAPAAQPLGHSFQRRAHGRTSTSAIRRDTRS